MLKSKNKAIIKMLISALVLGASFLLISTPPALAQGSEQSGPRCIRENSDGSVDEGGCAGYYIERGTQYPFESGKCYYIVGLKDGPPDFKIDEMECDEVNALIASGGPSNHEADCKPEDGEEINKSNCGIVAYLVDFINLLTALVGIVIVIMVVIGGIQYSAARDNPQAVAAARGRITNALLALLLYIFGFAILQWLVPGGIF